MFHKSLFVIVCASAAAMLASCSMMQHLFPPPATAPAPATQPATRPAPSAAQRDAMNAALAKVAAGRCDQAVPELSRLAGEFERACDLPQAGECHFWIAFCAEKQGRSQQAITQYKQVVAKFPATPAARQAQARLDLLQGQ